MVEGNPELEQIFMQASGGASDRRRLLRHRADDRRAGRHRVHHLVGDPAAQRGDRAAGSSRCWLLRSAGSAGRPRSLVTTLGGTLRGARGHRARHRRGLRRRGAGRRAGVVPDRRHARLPARRAGARRASASRCSAGRRRLGGLAWAVLTVCVVIGWLGELLSLPDAVVRLSPYDRTPQMHAGRARLDAAAGAHRRRDRAHRSRPGRTAAARPRDRVTRQPVKSVDALRMVSTSP